jgi:hypothetical protein
MVGSCSTKDIRLLHSKRLGNLKDGRQGRSNAELKASIGRLRRGDHAPQGDPCMCFDNPFN